MGAVAIRRAGYPFAHRPDASAGAPRRGRTDLDSPYPRGMPARGRCATCALLLLHALRQGGLGGASGVCCQKSRECVRRCGRDAVGGRSPRRALARFRDRVALVTENASLARSLSAANTHSRNIWQQQVERVLKRVLPGFGCCIAPVACACGSAQCVVRVRP